MFQLENLEFLATKYLEKDLTPIPQDHDLLFFEFSHYHEPSHIPAVPFKNYNESRRMKDEILTTLLKAFNVFTAQLNRENA